MKILGIDPGLNKTGWAIITRERDGSVYLESSGLISTSLNKSLSKRLLEIFQKVRKVITKESPVSVAIEEVYFTKKATTQMNTIQARGVILLACELENCPSKTYNPKIIKKTIAGNGNADKLQIQKMTQLILNLKQVPKPDDIADAIAVALCHARIHPIEEKIKKALSQNKKTTG